VKGTVHAGHSNVLWREELVSIGCVHRSWAMLMILSRRVGLFLSSSSSLSSSTCWPPIGKFRQRTGYRVCRLLLCLSLVVCGFGCDNMSPWMCNAVWTIERNVSLSSCLNEGMRLLTSEVSSLTIADTGICQNFDETNTKRVSLRGWSWNTTTCIYPQGGQQICP